MDDAAIHCVSRGRGRVRLFVYWFTVDRHGLRPRDEKGEGKRTAGRPAKILLFRLFEISFLIHHFMLVRTLKSA